MAMRVCAQTFVNDPTFNVVDQGYGYGIGPSSGLEAVVHQSDGKILIAGFFHSYDWIERHGVARLNVDGSLDQTFDPGTGPVFSNSYNAFGIKLQANDQTIVFGDIYSFDGADEPGILRLNLDGSVDTTFHSGIALGSIVYDAAIQPDGRIVIAGNFTTYDGIARNRVARLNYDGSLDLTFVPPTTPNLQAAINVGLRSDGKVIACYKGNWNSFSIHRLDTNGGADPSFTIASTDFGNYVSDVIVSPDDEIMLVGSFDAYAGVPCNGIVRLLPDGIVDMTFEVSLLPHGACGTGYSTYYYTLALQPDEKIIVSGAFAEFGDSTRHNVMRLLPDGSLDSGFNPGLTTGIHAGIDRIDLQADGKILLAGSFRANRWHITRLNTDGTFDASFDPNVTGLNSTAGCAVMQANGKPLVGGGFTSFNNTPRKALAMLELDGSLDASFDPGTGVDSRLMDLAIQPDDKVLVAGDICYYNDQYVGDLFRLLPNGAVDTGFQFQGNFGYGMNTVCVAPDGRIIYAGYNYSYGAYPDWIKRVLPDGAPDVSFQPDTGLVYIVWRTVVQPDGKVIVGGYIDRINGHQRKGIARLNQDGSLDTTFNPGAGVNALITNIVVDDLGRILIGGNFTSVDSVAQGYIARLLPDGSLDTSFNTGSGADNVIRAITIAPDGGIFIGGGFTTFNGMPAPGIARLQPDGSFDTSADFGSGTDGSVNFLLIQPDLKILVGGTFVSFDGVGRNHITRIMPNMPTGWSDEVAQQVSLFPNPSSGVFRISGDLSGPTEISITNVSGQQVHHAWMDQRNNTVDLTSEPAGLYMVVLRNSSGTSTVRLLKR